MSAEGSRGPDFSETQRDVASALVKSGNVAHIQVVSNSNNRHERFRQVNSEINRVSDLMICLVNDDKTQGGAGGTNELVERAIQGQKPILIVRYKCNNDEIKFENEWCNLEHAVIPTIPREILHLENDEFTGILPSIQEYCKPLKKMASEQSRSQRKFFQHAAAWVILAHIVATFCATLVLSYPKHKHVKDYNEPKTTKLVEEKLQEEGTPKNSGKLAKTTLLLAELLMLFLGWRWHQKLHHSNTGVRWATARVVAEIARSISSIFPMHFYLEHLFRLALPYRFRYLLRTLNVLHLNSTSETTDNWRDVRKRYLSQRVEDQINYYQKANEKDRNRLKMFNIMFLACVVAAFIATLLKLVLLIVGTQIELNWLLGILAVLLPVLAVGGLSWASALDYQARIETYSETIGFLRRQKKLIVSADTNAEFEKLVFQTEAVLLGEVTNWYSRRANINVA